MQDDFITWSELAWVVAFLGWPVIVAAAVGQVAYLSRRGLGQAGRRRGVIVAAGCTAVAVYVLTPVVWVLVPPSLLDWPGTIGNWPFMIGGVFFVPSLLAALVAAPVVAWLTRRRAPA